MSTKDGREKAPSEAKRSFWSLKRQSGKDDAIEHPPFERTLPQVNLLPASIKDAIAARRLRHWLAGAAVLMLVAVAGVWFLQSGQISRAEEAQSAAQAENAQLQSDLGALNPVKQMYEQISRLKGVVTTTIASQPEAAAVLKELDAAGVLAGRGGGAVVITTANVNYTGIPTGPSTVQKCPNPDPFSAEVAIGCVTFTATAANREQVSELLRVLEDNPLFSGPFVTATSVGTGGESGPVTFSGTAGIALEALKTKLTPEQIEQLLNPAPATPAPAASEGAS